MAVLNCTVSNQVYGACFKVEQSFGLRKCCILSIFILQSLCSQSNWFNVVRWMSKSTQTFFEIFFKFLIAYARLVDKTKNIGIQLKSNELLQVFTDLKLNLWKRCAALSSFTTRRVNVYKKTNEKSGKSFLLREYC